MSGAYTAETWAQVAVPFAGRVASPADVEAGLAVFALGDTLNPEPLDLGDPLPQPAIWYDDDIQTAVVILQAEIHDTSDGETLQPLGLLLPDGRTMVGFFDDVDLVDATDPVWRELVEDALFAPQPSEPPP